MQTWPLLATGSSGLVAPGAAEWASALERVRHDVYHLPSYARLDAESQDGQPVAFIYEAGGHVLLLPLVIRSIPGTDHCDATSPYGYPGPVADTVDEGFWRAAVRQLVIELDLAGVVSCFVRLHPLLPTADGALAEVGLSCHHGSTVRIDLSLDEAEIWHHVRHNHRRQIHRSQNLGHTVAFNDWSMLPEFATIYFETMTRVSAAESYFYSQRYFEALRDALPDQLHLAVVRDENDVAIAGGLFFESCGIMQYHLGGTLDSALREQPAKLMIDAMWRWAKQRNNDVLHLGGGRGGEDGPLLHFKLGFSHLTSPFDTWHLVVNAQAYDDLTPAGSGPTSYFPAYRAAAAMAGELTT